MAQKSTTSVERYRAFCPVIEIGFVCSTSLFVILGLFSAGLWEQVLEPVQLHLFFHEHLRFIREFGGKVADPLKYQVMYSWIYMLAIFTALVLSIASFREQYFKYFLNDPSLYFRYLAVAIVILYFFPGHYGGTRTESYLYGGVFSFIINGVLIASCVITLFVCLTSFLAFYVRKLLGMSGR